MSCKPKWILHWLEMHCSVDGNLIVHMQAGSFIIFFLCELSELKQFPGGVIFRTKIHNTGV